MWFNASIEVELYRSPSASGTKDWAIAMNPNGGKVSVFFGKTGSTMQQREISVDQGRKKRLEKINKGYQLMPGRWAAEVSGGRATLQPLLNQTEQPTEPVQSKPDIDLLAIMESESDLDVGLV